MAASSSRTSGLSFEVTSFTRAESSLHVRLRVGRLRFSRGGGAQIDIQTPGVWTHTSRGVVPHLTRDHLNATPSIKGIHIPFESYLEVNPPVPPEFPGSHRYHRYHNLNPERHIVSFGLRDPLDAEELHANGQEYVIARCARGSKTVTPPQFSSYATLVQADIIFALPDIPYTPAPYSQKRLTKSNERTVRWLTTLLKHQHDSLSSPSSESESIFPPAIFAHLLGGSVPAARSACSNSLLEPLEGKDSLALPHIPNLDQAISGYIVDLVPLRLASLLPPFVPLLSATLVPLVQASLEPLDEGKVRFVTGVCSPHEILRCVLELGIDVFDSGWAQKCADYGIALDFRFPVPPSPTSSEEANDGSMSKRIGAHNLYDEAYAMDFSSLSDSFVSAKTYDEVGRPSDMDICHCFACSPVSPDTEIRHGKCDEPIGPSAGREKIIPPFTRAYIHHLLHTHEMSAHTLLVSHNLFVLDKFFANIRSLLSSSSSIEFELDGTNSSPTSTSQLSRFEQEVHRFNVAYDEEALCGVDGLVEKGRKGWRMVEDLRGKGRLKREKEKEKEKALEVGAGLVEVE